MKAVGRPGCESADDRLTGSHELQRLKQVANPLRVVLALRFQLPLSKGNLKDFDGLGSKLKGLKDCFAVLESELCELEL
jgi:hypothetical protein